MLYVKYKGKRIPIEEDNVVTQCPDCGKWHSVDLVEVLEMTGGDLYGSMVYCEECTAKREEARQHDEN